MLHFCSPKDVVETCRMWTQFNAFEFGSLQIIVGDSSLIAFIFDLIHLLLCVASRLLHTKAKAILLLA
jgi:hypothetical protein